MKMKKIVHTLLGAILLMTSLGTGCSQLFPTQQGPSQPVGSQKGLDTIDEAWKVVFENYVDRNKLDATKLSQGAIKGMLEALDDPYTSYLGPDQYQSEVQHMRGSYQGIGAYVGTRNGKTIILSALPDSPAEKAGVKSGDIIIDVDGKSTDRLSLEEVVGLIRGPAGTTVVVTFHRESTNQDLKISLTRAAIAIKTVTWEMKGDIAYVRISQFAEPTAGEFDSAVRDIVEKQSKGLAMGMVLDLRSNPGGLLDTVVDMASHFFPDGVVLQVVDKDGKRTQIEAKPRKDQISIPLIILVDEYSASGSEVLSGALRDRIEARIAGHKTFGKGSVNRFWDLPDGGAIYVTISRWETPNGTAIEGKGIEPDFKSDLLGDDMVSWAIDYLHQQLGTKTSAQKVLVPVA